MSTQLLGLRLDKQLAAAIRDRAAASGVPISSVVRQACRAHFGLDTTEVDGRRFNRFPANRRMQESDQQ